MLKCVKLLVVLIVILNSLGIQAQESTWGLRNLEFLYTLPDSHYDNHNPKYVAFWLRWRELQPNSPPLEKDTLLMDSLLVRLNRVKNLGAVPVIVLHLTPSTRMRLAMVDNSESYTGPVDLVRNISLSAPIPAKGYSDTLYNLVDTITRFVANNYSGDVYFRCHNEPNQDWALGGDTRWEHNIQNYERCLRTFHKAAHDAAIAKGNISVHVSHGDVPRGRQQEKLWFQLGDTNFTIRDSLRNLFRSSKERSSSFNFANWLSVTEWASTNSSNSSRKTLNRKADLWLRYFHRWTARGYVDWNDIHHHFKPRFLLEHISLFDSAVVDSVNAAGIIGNAPLPWMAVEAAMGTEADTNYVFYPDTIPYLDTIFMKFHADDMVRKWTIGMRSGLIASIPPYVSESGFKPPGTPIDWFGLVHDTDANFPYLADAAYIFLQSKIPTRDVVVVKREDSIWHYRFKNSTLNWITDVVWKDELFDTLDNAVPVTINFPPGKNKAKVFNSVGTLLTTVQNQSSLTLNVAQAPRIIIFSKKHVLPIGDTIAIGKMQPTLEEETLTTGITLYPNPALHSVTISLNSGLPSETGTYQLLNLSGQVLRTGTLEQQLTEFSLENIATGVYLMEVRIAGITFKNKLVIAK